MPPDDDDNFELPTCDDDHNVAVGLPLLEVEVELPCDDCGDDDVADDPRLAQRTAVKRLKLSQIVPRYPYTARLLQQAGVPQHTLHELKTMRPLVKTAEDLMEVFSPPRLVPIGCVNGLIASLSVDAMCGWNLTDTGVQGYVKQHLHARRPRVLMVSPPCTPFSCVQNLNKGRMEADLWQRKLAEGEELLDFSMELCALQMTARPKRAFVFEHPQSASSWQRPSVQNILAQPGVRVAHFDDCRFGLTNKMSGMPMKTATTLMTNVDPVFNTFHNVRCLGDHIHQPIRGNEGGIKRSEHAACYPVPMVNALVRAVCMHVGKQMD